LPICKNTKDEEITTECFRKSWLVSSALFVLGDVQHRPRRDEEGAAVLHGPTDSRVERDSLKDKMVVYAFILLTVGLLAYAAFEPYLKPKLEVRLWLHTA